MSTPSPSESPQILPPHLEQAPAVPTVPAEAPKSKAHPLRPIHLSVLNAAAAKASEIMDEARATVAADLGVSGPFRVQPDPETGGIVLIAVGP